MTVLSQELADIYNEAENAIKKAEIHTSEPPVPALNEMRYAGQHALAYVNLPDGVEKNEEYAKAKAHAKRAYFDAYDYLLMSLLEEVHAYQETIKGYSYIAARIIGPRYSSFKEQTINAKEYSSQCRLKKQDKEEWSKRDEHYKEFDDHVANVGAFLKAIKSCEEEILEEVARRIDEISYRKNEEKDRKSWVKPLVIGTVAGILAFIIGTIVFMLFLQKPLTEMVQGFSKQQQDRVESN